MSSEAIITLIFTGIIALFTGLTYKVYRRLHSDDYQQDLIFDVQDNTKDIRASLLQEQENLSSHIKNLLPDRIFGIQCTFVNPGKVPMIIDKIEMEPLPEKQLFRPGYRPERVYISSLPWIIGGGGFAIYWACFDDKREINVSVSYRCHKHNKYGKTMNSYKIYQRKRKKVKKINDA